MLSFTRPPPIALYVHVPWCVRRCPYCDFNSHALREALPEDDYVAALLADLAGEAAAVRGRAVSSVFIGGGTPSLLGPAAVARLLDGIAAQLDLASGCEITLEANPGTVDAARFRGFRAAGVNRLSIGIQSFDDACLRAIGRIHDGAAARAAARAAREAGFERVNLDLMFGLPGQDRAGALADLAQALDLAPEHLSHYQLTLEPRTPFHRSPPPLPGAEALWAMQQACAERLAQAGYDRYEVSAHALPGARCRHNLNYWRFGDYLGIGAGAHGKLTDVAAGSVVRTLRHRHPRRYLAGTREGFVAERRALDDGALVVEFMLNALRLTEGFEPALFTESTGLPDDTVARPLAEAEARGLVERSAARVRASALGQRFLDDLLVLFVSEAAGACA